MYLPTSSHAHAQAFEANREQMQSVIVFPASFFASIKTVRPSQGLTQAALDQLRKAHLLVSAYDAYVWSSTLILIPAYYHNHWILFAVCNAALAQPKNNVAPPCQEIEPGDRRPDQRKFCILSLNARGETPERLRRAIGMYLGYHYLTMRGEHLEYVDDWEATVRSNSPRYLHLSLDSSLCSVPFKSTALAAGCTQSVKLRS